MMMTSHGMVYQEDLYTLNQIWWKVYLSNTYVISHPTWVFRLSGLITCCLSLEEASEALMCNQSPTCLCQGTRAGQGMFLVGSAAALSNRKAPVFSSSWVVMDSPRQRTLFRKPFPQHPCLLCQSVTGASLEKHDRWKVEGMRNVKDNQAGTDGEKMERDRRELAILFL